MIDDVIPARMITDVDGDPHVVVGWPLAEGAAYFEFFTLDDVSTTLQSVQLSLYLAGGITIALAIIAGVVLSRRAVRPVADAAMAAKAIAGGRLETRLATTADPDLGALADSFNEMARALQERIERDARFASDVSHELRSPLMTLAASIEVIEGRRDEMPDRARAAVDLLSSDVARFRTLVEDLLEISRFDAGAVRPNLDELLTAEFVTQAVAVSSLPDTPVVIDERAENTLITGDRRRLARVIANLIDNARIHGGGSARIRVEVPVMDSDITACASRCPTRTRRPRGGTAPHLRTVRPRRWSRATTRQRWSRTRSRVGGRARPPPLGFGLGGIGTRGTRIDLRDRTARRGPRR